MATVSTSPQRPAPARLERFEAELANVDTLCALISQHARAGAISATADGDDFRDRAGALLAALGHALGRLGRAVRSEKRSATR
jgi:Ser/Thr protein kinase RdoA (MazF antagonist)